MVMNKGPSKPGSNLVLPLKDLKHESEDTEHMVSNKRYSELSCDNAHSLKRLCVMELVTDGNRQLPPSHSECHGDLRTTCPGKLVGGESNGYLLMVG